MKLIFAQGNPGPQYARTRHNIGFSILDALAQAHDATWKASRIANADTAELSHNGEKVLLIKPGSFYNETGSVAQAFVQYYKLQAVSDILVLHDELALPFGTVRTRQKGSDAGNNGIKSLSQHLGADFWRIRIGIWNDLREQIDDADFVLSAFTTTERSELDGVTKKALDYIDDFLNGSIQPTTAK